jgi:beta-hydroxylase
LFFHVLHAIEWLFARFSVHGDRAVFDAREFAWTRELEASFPAIRAELERLLARREPVPAFHEISPEQRAITDDDRWKTYVLHAYGARANRNCRECPETAAAAERIPGMQTALFSILAPGKRIPPHRGPYKGLLRCHLGLVVPGPSGAAHMRVASTDVAWEEGRALVFDDTFEHEVWNGSDGQRIVLFIDFLRPMYFPLAALNRAILRAIVKSNYGRESMQRFSDWYAERGIDAGL